jgi:tetratricopeptide (TPR) repeat protein
VLQVPFAPSGDVGAMFAEAEARRANGDARTAALLLQSIIASDPRHAESRHRLGLLVLEAGDAAGALAAFDDAIALRPRAAHFHDSRGDALEALGRTGDAMAAWRTAIRLDPKSISPIVSLGGALTRSGQRSECEEAVQCYRRALALDPRAVAALNGLGLALEWLHRADEAEAAFRAACRLAPANPMLHANLGNVLRGRGQFDAAAASFAAALALDPRQQTARLGLARVHLVAERYGEAEAMLRALLAEDPNFAAAHLILAFVLLGETPTAEGWDHYEFRFAATNARRAVAGPNWDGAALAGRTLLVTADEGYGDFIQAARFIPQVARQGRVVVSVPPPLLRLALLMDGVAQVATGRDALPPFDVSCSALSLARACRAGAEPIPAEAPYLHPDPADAAAWKARLDALPGRTVGLAWAGNPEQRIDPIRSLPLAALAPLTDTAGVSFVSLQKDRRAGEVAATLTDWTGELLDFADTAALIAGLDLVIAVDTAVAHLAGALGRPVWLLNRWDGGTDPRWLRGRDDSPWYPTMRIFRQRRPHDWSDVIIRAAAALATFAA